MITHQPRSALSPDDLTDRATDGVDGSLDAFPEFAAAHRDTGTVDDDDEPQDEHAGENEAGVRETDENTEAPEEFKIDDEDQRDFAAGRPQSQRAARARRRGAAKAPQR